MAGVFILNVNWLICDMYIVLFTENVQTFVLDFSNIQYVANFLLYPKLAMAGEEELHGQMPGWQCDVTLPWESRLKPAKQGRLQRTRESIKLMLFMRGKREEKWFIIPF